MNHIERNRRLPVDFDYTTNFAWARREQARAVHGAVSALVQRVGRLFKA